MKRNNLDTISDFKITIQDSYTTAVFSRESENKIMFIKSLKITSESKIIREINFRKGMNLIIDETPENEVTDGTETGNSVGKTTVLQLIDFCLGGNPKGIYVDPDSKKEENVVVLTV